MRKTNEGLQIQTALERAELRLAEAIDVAQREKARRDAIEEAAADQPDPLDILKAEVGGNKAIYGYAPELSRSSKIENSRDEMSEEGKNLLSSVLKEDIIHESEHIFETTGTLKSRLEDEFIKDKSLLNEEFHGGYDALKEIANLNIALKNSTNKTAAETILEDSEDYTIPVFNEKNVFEDDNQGGRYEAEDILPSDFELHSFDDESEEKIIPYSINEALVRGDVIPPSIMDEDRELSPLPEDMREDESGSEADIEALNEQETENTDFESGKWKILEKARKEAEDILTNARLEAQKLVGSAKQEADTIIDEKVGLAMDEAREKGFAEGYEAGQKEGFTAAEEAVNLGMQEEAAAFRNELEIALYDFNDRKDEILEEHLNELTDLAVTVAEKVINISLKSSKDVVAKMIVAAAEHCRNKEWAKVYISHEDRAIAMNLEKELINALNQISSNVRVVVMDDEPSGTCIIETQDQIVDAGVETQMENIREIVADSKM